MGARIGISEFLDSIFFGHSPSKVGELFLLYPLVPLLPVSAIVRFLDVIELFDIFFILVTSPNSVIGPFLEAVSVFFKETSLFLESLTPGTNLLLRWVYSVGNWDPSIT